jgi:hypothetical protein
MMTIGQSRWAEHSPCSEMTMWGGSSVAVAMVGEIGRRSVSANV